MHLDCAYVTVESKRVNIIFVVTVTNQTRVLLAIHFLTELHCKMTDKECVNLISSGHFDKVASQLLYSLLYIIRAL